MPAIEVYSSFLRIVKSRKSREKEKRFSGISGNLLICKIWRDVAVSAYLKLISQKNISK